MQKVCVDCLCRSPDADTLYSLIGELGWRPLWDDFANSSREIEWRCPTCWHHFKERAMHPLPSSTTILARAAIEDSKDDDDEEPR